MSDMTTTERGPRYNSVDELLASCLPVADALAAAFDRVWTASDDTLHAECCGKEVTYRGGLGPDMAECNTCGSRVCDVLSPFVSPVLLSEHGNYTHVPSEEFVREMGARHWLSWKAPKVVEG